MTDTESDLAHADDHADCKKAFFENRFTDACDACRGITGDDASLGSLE